MPDIQPGLVHTVDPSRCGNCKHPRAAHVEGICLFDSTTFREEKAEDHMDCVCEVVTETAPPERVRAPTPQRVLTHYYPPMGVIV